MSKHAENPPVVLVVTDDRPALALLTDLLEAQRYKIISATSAYEALEITSARRVDLVISDVVMPGMDGMELCRRLKSSAVTSSTPVLLVSAIRKDRVDFSEGFAAGADEYVEVPFQHEELLVKVARLVERERAEDSLKKQNAEYRLMFDANPCPMYVVDEETLRFLAVNDAAVKHYGYTREEFLGMTALAIRPKEEVPAVVDYIKKNTAEYEAAGVWKHQKKDGTVIDVEVSWHRLKFSGQPAYLVSVNDITQQKRAANAAVESERRYRELFENANDIIYTHDLAGNFTSLNKTGEKVTGYSREEALRMNIADVLTPESMKTAKQMLTRKEHERVATVYDLDIFAKDGHRVSLEVSTRLIYQDGKPVGVQGIARDITSRKAAEYALKESEEKFRSIVETTNEWIWALDLDGRRTYTNPAVEEILGYSADEVLGKTALPFLHDEDRREVEKLLPQLISEKKGWTGLVLRWKHKHDGYRYLESNGLPVLDHAGNLIGYRGADRDITERKLVEEALAEQAERAALINRISQEVRRTLDISDVFKTAVRELGAHLGVDRCSLFMKDEKAGRVVNVAEYHVSDVVPAGSDFDLPQVRELNEAMEKYGVLAFEDVANDDRIRALYNRILKPFGVKSIIYVGVSVGDELLGAFALSTTKQSRHWSAVDIEVAKAAADQTGIAIRQARLYQKAEATSMREALVNKLSVAIRASLTLADVLDTAARELGHALSASRVQVRLCNSRNERAAQTEYIAAGESAHHFDRELEKFVHEHFVSSTEPLVIGDSEILSEGAMNFVRRVRAHTQQKKARSQIHYPLTVNGELSGVISIYQTDVIHRWDEDEILLVESVAAQLATGIAQAELFGMVARAKKEWESTFDAMSDGIFIFNPAGSLIRVNRAGAAMDNSRPEMILGRQCCEVLKATSSDTTCIVEQAFRHQRSINIEVVPENLKRPVLVTCEPVFNEAGQTVAAVCTARDLSELRTVEAVARERQSLLQNILESARESIYALDIEGRYKWCNQAMMDVTGYQMDELIGHHFLERVYEDDREVRRQKFAAALAGEPQSCESRYLAADGTLRYLSVNNAPIIVDGETRGVLGIAHDITEQKQERERAARADKLRALGQLASGVAHDFNNSLAAILGRAQLILRRVQDEEIIRSLGIIVTAAEDAAATVRRIQTFARKPLASELELLDMGSLLRDAIEITRTRWENEARAAGINVDVSLNAADGLFARGNASELREVFVNLIVNAVDAMPQGGKLTICCKSKGDRLRLRFADTGKGMTDEVRERIFEPFYTTKGVQGTGLGLAVSYGIIERHEGLITVESKVGRGTTFYVDFPVAEHSESSEADHRADVRTSSLSVLVVDDEPFVRDTLADMLSDLDHKVVTAEGGRQALEKVTTDDFDLVFTDLAMPEMDGWETARAIREHRPDLPVVLVTGYGAIAQPPSGEQDLVAGIIGKPFDFDQVTGTIARVCSGSTPHV